MDHLGNDPAAMVSWAANARPKEWAAFAREVFDHATRGDDVALALVQSSAAEVERLLDRLVALGAGASR